MTLYTTTKNDADMRLDRFLGKLFPEMSSAYIQRCIRQGKVRVGNRRPEPSDRLREGEAVRLFFGEQSSERRRPAPDRPVKADIKVAYEDGNFLVADKPDGQSVHGERGSLLSHALAYLKFDPGSENVFAPQLCHRIDRNTSGLVIIAKTRPALMFMTEKIRLREVEKSYICRVHGTIREDEGEYRNFILRNESESRVRVFDRPVPGAKIAVTRRRVIKREHGTTVLECTLETGRTHQIRAQFAHAGHPLVGDAKYGHAKKGEHQELRAYKIEFVFKPPFDGFEYLNGKVIRV